ncbi:hypothetical protein FSO04_35815 [Paraburkholderia madseniana]|uniref:Uncharacterized protein n=1 Tax=Paraburkholderia madseniana TaxID=2599607 RepID=A0A6N6W3D3_9BURK|nr:hypothetical protein FSO04_35815 [Paraburkholderia madseniana]
MAHPALDHLGGAQAGPLKQVHREQVARIRQARLAAGLGARAGGNRLAQQRRVVRRQETRLLFRLAPADLRQPGGRIQLQVADVAQPVEQRCDDFLGLTGRAVAEWSEKRSPVG